MSKMMVKRDGLWTPMANLKGDTGPLPADNSVTNDALVTDGAKTNTAYLMGNRLTATAEGEMVSVDDSYPSAALSLTVDGKSTQVTTTGKNLFNGAGTDNYGYYKGSTGAYVNSTNYKHWRISVKEGDVVRYNGTGAGLGCLFYQGEYVSSYNTSPFTVPAGVDEVTNNFASGGWNNGIVTLNNADLTYEPYSGGAASPRPDWPQKIESVDEPTLEVRALNLWGGERLRDDVLANAGYTSSGESDNGRWVSFGTAQTAGKRLYGGPFRENTQYTFILLVLRTNSTSVNVNLNLKYTDGTSVYMQRQAVSDVSQPSYIVLTSAAGKTVDGIYGVNHGNTTYIYYDYCGIFEGDVDIDSYEVYSGSTASLLPEGTSLRSLPDGTKDELNLTYLRPSTRKGWAWYEPALTQRVGEVDLGDTGWAMNRTLIGCFVRSGGLDNLESHGVGVIDTMCTDYIAQEDRTSYTVMHRTDKRISIYYGSHNLVIIDKDYDNAADFKEAVAGVMAYYPLATPITTQLDPIELPIMQAGTTNIWTDPSTSLSVTYERDRNIVISKLEAAAADLATS